MNTFKENNIYVSTVGRYIEDKYTLVKMYIKIIKSDGEYVSLKDSLTTDFSQSRTKRCKLWYNSRREPVIRGNLEVDGRKTDYVCRPNILGGIEAQLSGHELFYCDRDNNYSGEYIQGMRERAKRPKVDVATFL